MQKCKDCKYWDHGVCDLAGLEGDYSGFSNPTPASFDIFVSVDDDSGLWVELRTGPDFGCVRFAPNNNINA